MANQSYNFKYVPLTGKLPGASMVQQTEQAINELAQVVNEGSAQVEVLTNLANQANDNAAEALTKATEALETAGRVYITLPNIDDADSYYDSQLYYFANENSANLPVADTGFLEVKTNDTKTSAEQVFIADTTGLMYMRHGVITSSEVGGETVYSVTWQPWSSELASQDYVQQEVNTGVNTANSYTDDRIATEVTRADATYLPLTGGKMTGSIYNDVGTIIRRSDNTGFTQINAGTDDTSPYISMYGKNHTDGAGVINLRAINSTDDKRLQLNPNGSMTWGGVSLTDGTFLTTRVVSTPTITSSTVNGIYITAPAVSGYTFLCWIGSCSEGNVFPTYIQQSFANKVTGRVWWIGSPPTGNHIDCTALYIRKW